jgi:chromosome segregation ATPase
VKELEEDIALVGGQRDALNVQVEMASARIRTLEDEVVMLMGMVQERDEALSGAGREVEALRTALHDKDEALRAFDKTCGSYVMRSWVGRPTLRVNLSLCSGLGVEVPGLC